MRRIWASALAVSVALAAHVRAPAQEPSPPVGGVRLENVSRDDALRLAQSWIANDQPGLAEQLLAQIAPVWPDDARIPLLRGLAARALGDERAAVRHFRDALEINPNADRARYELARSYQALGDWGQAAFQYRFVLGADPPDMVKADVAARLMAITDRRWTTSFEAAIAPSSNINIAPSERTIDPILGSDTPAQLTADSTAQSGLGVRATGGVAREFRLAPDTPRRRWRGQVGLAGAVTDYEQVRFDDASMSVFAGVARRWPGGAVGGDVRWVRRWYGGEIYETAEIGRVFVDQRIADPLYLHLELSDGKRDNRTRSDYDGENPRASGRLRWSVSASAFLAAEASVTRFETSARATSYWDGGLALSAYKDFRGGWSAELTPGYSKREHDGPDPLFPDQPQREDDRWSLAASVVKRDLEVFGFAPFVRYRYTLNESTLALYDYDQHAAELGFTGVF